MKFFLDSADINEIKYFSQFGLIDGITTNPSIIAKCKSDIFAIGEEICSLINGPVSLEVAATKYDEMIIEGTKLSKIAKNIAVKLPLTLDGIKACRYFSEKDIMVNLTLCFSASQAIIAAKSGARFISPFVGRLDDINQDGLGLIAEICEIYSNYPEFTTQILVASVRSSLHVVQSARLGADIVTLPAKILSQLIEHPLTTKGLDMFLEDWQKSGQTIV